MCQQLCNSITKKLYFQPVKLGISIPTGGCEAAVHATRRFAESMPEDHCIVKLDFSNALNSPHRDAMLHAVSEIVPDICKFCFSSYNNSYSTFINFKHI